MVSGFWSEYFNMGVFCVSVLVGFEWERWCLTFYFFHRKLVEKVKNWVNFIKNSLNPFERGKVLESDSNIHYIYFNFPSYFSLLFFSLLFPQTTSGIFITPSSIYISIAWLTSLRLSTNIFPSCLSLLFKWSLSIQSAVWFDALSTFNLES